MKDIHLYIAGLLHRCGIDILQGMDDWNYIITIFVYCVSFWVLGIGIFYSIWKPIWKHYSQKLPLKRYFCLMEKSFSVPVVWIVSHILYIIIWIPLNILLLPIHIVDLVCQIVKYLKNPISFDREILSTNGKELLLFSVKIAVLVPLLFIALLSPISFLVQNNGEKYSSALGIYDTSNQEGTNLLWAVFSQYLDPGSISNSEGYGSAIALVLAALGIVCLSGLMVSSLVNWLTLRRKRWEKGLVLYDDVRSFKNYVVIIGCNEQTASIVRQSLRRDGVDYVLIQTRKDVKKARLDLELKMDDDLEDRIVFYAGERTSAEDIGKLHLEKAVEVFVLGESVNDPDEFDHDAFNIRTLDHIIRYRKEHKCEERIRVHVDFEYQSTFTAFKATHLYQKLGRDVEFVPFNVHEIWAKKVLVDNFAIVPIGNKAEVKVQRYVPIDTYLDNGERKGITEDVEKSVRLFIFGMNQMGTALATQAALLCHFPNFARDKKNKTTITCVDDHAIDEANYFMGRFSELFKLSRYRIIDLAGAQDGSVLSEERSPYRNPILNADGEVVKEYKHLLCDDETDLMDIQWEFIQGNVASPIVQQYVCSVVSDKDEYGKLKNATTIAICFNRSEQSQAAAMYLPKSIFKDANQVLVYQQSIFDLINDVADGGALWKRYENMYPFGMIEGSYTENPFDNILAKLDYCFYRHKDIKDKVTNILKGGDGDYSGLLDQVDEIWNHVGIVRKIASIDSVESINFHLRSMDCKKRNEIYSIGDKEPSPCIVVAEHQRWMTQRLMSGYRPLTIDEQHYDKVLQDELKEKERAHVGICTYAKMFEIAHDRCKLDQGVILDIPSLLRGKELLSVLRLGNPRYQQSRHQNCLKLFFRNDGGKGVYNSFVYIDGFPKDEEFKQERFCTHHFWISDTTVTRKQWYTVMGKDLSQLKDEDLPMVGITKTDVDDFLDVLRKRSGLYFELPSLKEWNVAALKFGGYESSRIIKSTGKNKPVNARISGLNKDADTLHHIFGNVWEWTHTPSKHRSNAYHFCGGSFLFGEDECDLDKDYYTNAWDENSSSDDLGFRLMWGYDRNVIFKRVTEERKKKEGHGWNLQDTLEWFSSDNHKFIRIKEGFFIMGTSQSIDADSDKNECPRHVVQISESFYMCQVPVTQSLWNAVKGLEPMKNPTKTRLNSNFPQTNISWNDVKKFIEELNRMKSQGLLSGILPSNTDNLVFRLPTEAEWEYAAKGGNGKDKPIGENDLTYPLYAMSDGETADSVAWYNQPTIHEVAEKKANACGLYDMSGNVWEWCYDSYISNMYEKCKKGIEPDIQKHFVKNQYNDCGYITDPVALSNAYSAHVFRGGSWRSTKWDCRCTRANFWNADYGTDDLGFRLVLGNPI